MFKFIEDADSDFKTVNRIIDETHEKVGYAQGQLNRDGYLISAVRVNPNYYNEGHGFELFRRLFELHASEREITGIISAWYVDDEFNDLEGGQSTNLTVFKREITNGQTLEGAALATPTGKWASRLGFDRVIVDHIDDRGADIRYTR
jgi:hypothetical protein